MARFFIFCAFLFGYSQICLSQLCGGSLGENIFTEGDFGSGSANILNMDPGIAPGYTYQFAPPPDDGNYCITNNTSNWGSFATSSWVNIKDNSNDPNGYMMVVNASFTAGLFYEQTITGLCDNTEYAFSADLINLLKPGLGEIAPNVSFLINGQVRYTTGNVPENGEWETYGFIFTTAPAQTSITLALQNNAAGGQGNDLALDNITFRACGPEAFIEPEEKIQICAQDLNPFTINASIIGDQYPDPSYQWQISLDGINWSDIPGENNPSFSTSNLNSGTYYYRYLLSNNEINIANPFCRVASTLKEVEVLSIEYQIIDTICEGLIYELGDLDLNSTGIYRDTLTSQIGCDSIVILDLTTVDDLGINAEYEIVNPSCYNVEDGELVIQQVNNVYAPFMISGNGENFDNLLIMNELGNQTITIEIIDRHGCSFTDEIDILSPPEFTLDLGENLEVDLGSIANTSVTASEPVISYSWDPTEWVDCEMDCSSLSFTPTASGYLTGTVLNDQGCRAKDSIFIELVKNRLVYIPNIFSPNGDGLNDVFAVYASQPNVQEILSFQIYDRWGSLVFSNTDFQPNDISQGWNGMLDSKEILTGIYSYQVEVRFLDDEAIRYSGNVSLLR